MLETNYEYDNFMRMLSQENRHKDKGCLAFRENIKFDKNRYRTGKEQLGGIKHVKN